MKKNLTTIFFALSCFSLFLTSNASFAENFKVINALTLTEQDLLNIVEAKEVDTVIEFAENTEIPLELFIDGDLLGLVPSNEPAPKVIVKRTFYARFINDNFQFTLDFKEWKPLRKFIKGTVSFGLTEKDNQIFIKAGAKANLR